LPDIQESIRELRRAVKDLGMKAVKFNGGWGDGDLDNEVLWPLYEEIAALDIPILLLVCSKLSTAIRGSSAANAIRAFSIFPRLSASR
jgi:predicted TIM-barrel fold metal-dependent hydrolase